MTFKRIVLSIFCDSFVNVLITFSDIRGSALDSVVFFLKKNEIIRNSLLFWFIYNLFSCQLLVVMTLWRSDVSLSGGGGDDHDRVWALRDVVFPVSHGPDVAGSVWWGQWRGASCGQGKTARPRHGWQAGIGHTWRTGRVACMENARCVLAWALFLSPSGFQVHVLSVVVFKSPDNHGCQK